ncbi:MAG: peptide-methionine (S)-S-oxide reductase MsrA [Planctomycetota bacterium]|jgi:peptide-methionine (S)-S-oxide reductase
MTTRQATFGAGCFWGVEAEFRRREGVVSTEVGYAGGSVDNASYRQVCSGMTGHAEVVRVEFDPERVSYAALVRLFFSIHDPTQLNRQGPDVGTQYRSVIFFHDTEQETAARVAKDEQGPGVVTQIEPAGPFWRAEDDHQQYFEKRGQIACASTIRR